MVAERRTRPIHNLDPGKVRAIRKHLAANPTISRKDLAQRVGLSRTALWHYLRGITEQGLWEALWGKAQEGSSWQSVSATTPMKNSGQSFSVTEAILDRIRAMDEVNARLDELPWCTAVAQTKFRAYEVQAKYLKLLAEILGEVAPAQTFSLNAYQVFLDRDVDASKLPPEVARLL